MSIPSLESRIPLLTPGSMTTRCTGAVSSFLVRHRENARARRWLRGLERELADLDDRQRLEVLYILARNKT